MKSIIEALLHGKDLSREVVGSIITAVEKNEFEEVQLAAVLTAMEAKGITPEELHYFIEHLITKAVLVEAPPGSIDVCGTGGDKKQTFNVSTATAIVVASCGVPVAKHGNRAVSSKSGSFDVLEQLGIVTDAEKNKKSLDAAGIGFFFAPHHHPVFKNIAPTRKKLGIKTIFNMMGPLLNPCKVQRQLIGVFDPSIIELIAETMKRSNITQGMVVHGDGLDEITITGTTNISELKNGKVTSYVLDPKEYGITYGTIEDLHAGSSAESAQIIRDILAGKRSKPRDIVILNAAAGLIVAGRAADFKEGIAAASRSIDDGKALETFQKVQEIMNQ